MLKIHHVVLSLFLSVASAAVSSAATFYLDPLGNDRNPCTETEPCQTVARAQTTAAPGDVVEFAPGIYSTTVSNRLTKSGTAGNPITYRGHSVGCETLPNSDPNAPRRRPHPQAVTGNWVVQASYVTIDCFEIRPSPATSHLKTDGIAITGTNRSSIRLVNNYIHDGWTKGNCRYGIQTEGSYAVEMMTQQLYVGANYITGCKIAISVSVNGGLIEYNEFFRMTTLNGDIDYTRGFGANLTIRRNYMHGTRYPEDCGPNDAQNCHIDCFLTYNNLEGPPGEVLRNFVFDGNVCFNFHQGIIARDKSLGNPGVPSGSHATFVITNNVFARHPGNAIAWCMLFDSILDVYSYHNVCAGDDQRSAPLGYRAGTTAAHRNNIHFNVGRAPIITTMTGGTPGVVTNTSNIYFQSDMSYSYPGNMNNVDPLFQDLFSGIYKLSPGSPGIDAGTSVDVKVDRDGSVRPRGAGPDIGAYEAFFPSVPTNLRIPR